ncbi:MAG: hypothetical protein EZS28_037582 [Streblomastix strix]|uniref:Secreted protein n=1 Tax=Streblomastix strix TaxID=222440 RepID=A0A5J4UAG1_9EUKA|nr:MAG: hypothetical protein EZS28_037582 [Streblomastix strix]
MVSLRFLVHIDLLVLVLMEVVFKVLSMEMACHYVFSQPGFLQFVQGPGSHSSSRQISLFVSRLLLVLTGEVIQF